MLKRLLKKSEGFTLIELIVVIAIIAILATIGILAFTRVQAQARDTKRKGDLRAMAQSVQLYYNDNGNYPTAANFTAANMANYMPSIPTPPAGTTQATYTYVGTGGAKFGICALLETGTGATPNWKVSAVSATGAPTAEVVATCTEQ